MFNTLMFLVLKNYNPHPHCTIKLILHFFYYCIMRYFFLLIFTLTTTTLILGQDAADTAKAEKFWRLESIYGLNATQSTFVHWVAGGQNNVSALGFINANANYKKDNSSWKNELRLALGAIRFFETTTTQQTNVQKTDDVINFASKYGYKVKEHWFLTALGDFRTQFLDGFVNPLTDTVAASTFMAPGFSIFALGIDYIPNKDFSILMAPATGKFTFVRDQRLSDLGAFGVTPGSNFRPEVGAYIKFRWRKDLMKNVEMITRAEFFSNYLEKPQNIDVNLETMFTFKVNEVFSAMLQLNLLYDDDIRVPVRDANGVENLVPRTQFRQIMGIGIQYRMANFKR